jgi:hypothetical protein
MTFLNQWGKLLTSMIKTLLQTDSDYVYTFLRIIAGIIVFPYGMQKLFGWFSALGFGADAKAHKPKPTNTTPGITYMLAGATQRSDSDPNDMTSMPIEVGPHWMIMWPFDPKSTGLPVTHKDTGTFMHIMGRP